METDALPKDLERRLKLYAEALHLHSQGMSNRSIALQLGVSKDIVSWWLAGHRPKRVSRYEPDLTPSKELAYVAGFYLGDGKYAGEEHKVRFELADRMQLECVGRLVAGLLGRDPKSLSRDGAFYTVQYDSVVLSNFLDQDIDVLVEYLKDFIPDFLRGFFDAEGYASCSADINNKLIGKFQVGAENTNLDYLESVTGLLKSLGFSPNVHRTNKRGQKMTIRGRTWTRRNDVYHITLNSRLDIMRFNDCIGFENPAKKAKLNNLLVLLGMEPRYRFDWFMSRYRKEGRKWVEKVQIA